MTELYLIGLNHFDAGAEGGAEGGSESGLTGDFDADFSKAFGRTATPAVGRAKTTEAEGTQADGDAVTAQAGADSAAQTTAQTKTESNETTEVNTAAAGQNTDIQTDVNENVDTDEFEKLIGKDGKFRKQYEQRVQDIIKQRYRQNKQAEEAAAQRQKSMLPLYKKYGVKVGDDAALAEAVEKDNSLLEERAFKNGLTVDAQKKTDEAEYLITQQQEQQKARQAAEQAAQAVRELENQALQLKKTYPDFDLRREITSNKDFAAMIDKGISVEMAYKATNHDRLLQIAMAYTADRASKQTLEGVRANRERPAENGTSQAVGSAGKPDVASMTEAQIMDIINRVGRGEKISL